MKLVLPEMSYKIMGVIFKVHNELGPALLEKYYQRAIDLELEKQGLSFEKEVPVDIIYFNKKIGKYYLDFIIEKQVIIETKAHEYSDPKFSKQTLAYLKQTNLPLAILVNFRRQKVEYKRIINPNYKKFEKIRL